MTRRLRSFLLDILSLAIASGLVGLLAWWLA